MLQQEEIEVSKNAWPNYINNREAARYFGFCASVTAPTTHSASHRETSVARDNRKAELDVNYFRPRQAYKSELIEDDGPDWHASHNDDDPQSWNLITR